MQRPLIAAIEAGGTKFNLTVGYSHDQPLEKIRFSTTHPEQTFQRCQAFLAEAADRHGPPAGIGIASFGPIDIRPDSPSYGTFMDTPKPGWTGADFRAALAQFRCPVVIDTDVNAAALAEYRARAMHGKSLAYITLGTGLGVGLCNDGSSLHSHLHPELGHLHSEALAGEPAGTCPFHPHCIEGLICGPALAKRWDIRPEQAPDDHPLWDNLAHHLATLCRTVTLAYSPHSIVLGGGVMQRPGLFQRLNAAFSSQIGNYLAHQLFPQGIDQFIEPPSYADAGLVGAFYLAHARLAGHEV